jgi:hypothetical protein
LKLLGGGVTLFLDLTEEENKGLRTNSLFLDEPDANLGRHAGHRRMPIPDVSTPSVRGMVQTLDAIDVAINGGETVYVRFWGVI